MRDWSWFLKELDDPYKPMLNEYNFNQTKGKKKDPHIYDRYNRLVTKEEVEFAVACEADVAEFITEEAEENILDGLFDEMLEGFTEEVQSPRGDRISRVVAFRSMVDNSRDSQNRTDSEYMLEISIGKTDHQHFDACGDDKI